ncbi:DNA primase [Methanocella sp. CWC-04]|uniref:UPF0292 protein CUJ83_05675 n=1 Tax=Methanooceanicella nereidis TaxID=2052831 RepID=A0AAP2RBV6_9EURY|nr:toprim domain-containing protein [Methanocella sp. CWC-04]MCD1294488.1 DNA primase [Methanocella sp. CWC-04]
MDDRERLEEIQALIDEIADRAMHGATILVEGKRDRDSLISLGVHGDIVMTSQKQLFNLAEELAREKKDIVVLTDWDERGDEVALQMETYLKADGARPDCDLRSSLKDLVKKEIKDIESLYKYVQRLKEVCSSKPQHY